MFQALSQSLCGSQCVCCGKSTLFRHLYGLLERARDLCHVHDDDPVWVVGDASFEKMGALMSDNSSRLLGIYDELTTFLGQLNIYRGRQLTESHELSVFLQLFNGHPWRRDTGKRAKLSYPCMLQFHLIAQITAIVSAILPATYVHHTSFIIFPTFLVSGEANFAMQFTHLTVGGFTQPGVARSLVEQPSNADKGLSHRFTYVDFSQNVIWEFQEPWRNR